LTDSSYGIDRAPSLQGTIDKSAALGNTVPQALFGRVSPPRAAALKELPKCLKAGTKTSRLQENP
jgi:hypothetical protein